MYSIFFGELLWISVKCSVSVVNFERVIAGRVISRRRSWENGEW